MYHSTTSRGRVALIFIIVSFLATRWIFDWRHPSSYYQEVHAFAIHGVCAMVSGTICIAYAWYLHRHPPSDDQVRLRDSKTREFQPLKPIHHDIAGIPIEIIGPVLFLSGIGMCVWEHFHPKF